MMNQPSSLASGSTRSKNRAPRLSFARRALSAAALSLATLLPSAASAATVYDTVRLSIAIGEETATVDIRLLPNAAPKTATNFLRYINSGAYLGTFLHRSVEGFIVQGGGFVPANTSSGYAAAPNYGTVVNEYNLHNTRGTIAMAKLGNDPNSASNQWFVNIGDNRANLDNQNGGFTVFAELATADSIAVFDRINDPYQIPVYNMGSPLDEIPLIDERIPLYIASTELIGRDDSINDRIHNWVGGTSGTWDTYSDTWEIINGNGVIRPFAQGNEAAFTLGTGETREITIAEPIYVSDLKISGDGDHVFRDSSITGAPSAYTPSSTGSLVKNGTGQATFSGVALKFYGGAQVNAGTLALVNSTFQGHVAIAPGAVLLLEQSTVEGIIFGDGLLRATSAFLNRRVSPGTPTATSRLAIGTLDLDVPSFNNTEGALLFEIAANGTRDTLRNTSATNIVIGGKIFLDFDPAFLGANDNIFNLKDFLESAPGAGTIEFALDELDPDFIDITYILKEFDRATGEVEIGRNVSTLPGIRNDLTRFAETLNYVANADSDAGFLGDFLTKSDNPGRDISHLSPLAFSSMTAMPIGISSDATNALRNHLANLRLSKPAANAAKAAGRPGAADAPTVAATAAHPAPPLVPVLLSTYFYANGSFTENDNASDNPFFDTDTNGGTIGIDYTLNRAVLAGFNLAANTGRAKIHDGGGKVRLSQFRVSAYASYEPASWLYVDGAIHVGFSDFESTRDLPQGIGRNTADANGRDYGAALFVGSRLPIGSSFNINPFVGIEYVQADVKHFQEDGSEGYLPLEVNYFDQSSLRAKAGVEGSWHFADGLRLSLAAAYSYELGDTEADIKARLVDYPGFAKFSVKAPSTAESLLQVGPTLDILINKHATFSVGYIYATDLKDQVTHHVTGTFNWRF